MYLLFMLISKHKGPTDISVGSIIATILYHVTFRLTHALHNHMVGLVISQMSTADMSAGWSVTHHLMLDPALKSYY